MIDEYEDPWRANQGVLKVQKWQKMVCRRAIRGPSLTILGHSGPLDKAPWGRHSPLSYDIMQDLVTFVIQHIFGLC